MRSGLDGKNATTSVSGLELPRGAYVNGDHIYWSDSSHNKLQDSDINGSSVETLLSMVNPLGIYAKTPDTRSKAALREVGVAALAFAIRRLGYGSIL